MPRVPRSGISEVGQTETRIVKQNVNVSSETFGGGQALQDVIQPANQLARQAIELEDKHRKQANDMAILEADEKMSRAVNTLLYDKDGGAMNAKGKNAFGLPDYVYGAFDENASKIENELANDEQKAEFRKRVLSRKGGFDRQIQMHVSNEGYKYDQQLTESYIKNERDSALSNFHNLEAVSLSVLNQRDAIRKNAERNGVSPDVLEQRLKSEQSKTLLGVMGNAIESDDYEMSKSHYDKLKSLMTPEDRQKAKSMLDAQGKKIESVNLADSIVAKYGDDMQGALEAAKNIKDPDIRDEVNRRVKGQFADMKSAELYNNENKFESMNDALVRSQGDIDAIPLKERLSLSARQQRDLDKYAAQLRSGDLAPKNSNEYYDLSTLASSRATRKQFLQTNLTDPKYRTKIDPGQLSSLITLQRQLRGQDDKADKYLDGIESKTNIVNSALAAADIDYRPNANKDEASRANNFRREVDRLVVERQEALGRKVTNEELRQITDDLMVEVRIKDAGFLGLFDKRVKRFETSPLEKGEVIVDAEDIPTNDREKIEVALRKRNLPVTDDAIINMYLEKLNRSR